MRKDETLPGLVPELRERFSKLMQVCEEAEFRVVPYQGYRSAAEQAKLWAQSRTWAEIDSVVAKLRVDGAEHLARLVALAKRGSGPRVTNALPGESWHQFRRAVDSYLANPSSGRALWRDRHMDGDEFGIATQLYERFGRLAEGFGLTWGGRWSIGDFGLVQLDRANSPLGAFGSWRALFAELAKLDVGPPGSLGHA